MLMLASSLFDGDLHWWISCRFCWRAKAGGSLWGRNLDYLEKGDDHRRACSLYLALMDRMGVPLESSAMRRRGL
jgi:hypothetical protein